MYVYNIKSLKIKNLKYYDWIKAYVLQKQVPNIMIK